MKQLSFRKANKSLGIDNVPLQNTLRLSKTDNPEMNEILKTMEKLLHWAAIIESSDDAIISKSADGYITSWNKGAERLYGYTADEIIGQPVSILMPSSKKDDFPYIMKQLQDGNKVEHYETQRITKNGHTLHVSLTVSPIRDPQGNIIGASKIARDITERIENERRRDEFVSTTSHELKTPLTSQKAFGELLERMIDKNNHKEYKQYIRKINQQTDKLAKLVEDLVQLSRVQSGGLKMESKKFSFDNLVKELVTSTRLISNHSINLHGKTHKSVKGDRERIGQVISNLLSNAIKYSPGSQKIDVSLRCSNDTIVMSVKDYGIGIPKEYHNRIFERFYRVTDDNQKTFPGMGIGLHVSREIAEHHNGKIWFKSESGKGSTFYFSLPFVT